MNEVVVGLSFFIVWISDTINLVLFFQFKLKMAVHGAVTKKNIFWYFWTTFDTFLKRVNSDVFTGRVSFPCKVLSCPGKENYCKVKPLQSDVAFSCLWSSGSKCNNNFFFFQSVMAILPLAITLILQGLKQYLDLKQYFPVQIQKKLPLCDYEMYLPVLKAVLNDLKESCQNET